MDCFGAVTEEGDVIGIRKVGGVKINTLCICEKQVTSRSINLNDLNHVRE